MPAPVSRPDDYAHSFYTLFRHWKTEKIFVSIFFFRNFLAASTTTTTAPSEAVASRNREQDREREKESERESEIDGSGSQNVAKSLSLHATGQ